MAASRALLARTLDGTLTPSRGTHVTGDSLVHDTALVRGKCRRSILGAHSISEGNLRDSVIWDDCRIAPGVVLESCVVAHGVEISAPVELRNVLICRDNAKIPRDGECRFEHGLVLRNI
jgi:ADP-glucose pyrophosphorylase